MAGIGASDDIIQLPTDGSGRKLRTIDVTTMVNGVATSVQMEVLSVADSSGNVIDDFADYKMNQAILRELRMIRLGIQQLLHTFGDALINDETEQDQDAVTETQ